ncbi:protein FAR1-RELATED SEQUENCE 11-like [Vicia villosa]|uniref:protein FAR1-RELATED SEQUENCE 11-like n=1 Tax=Vicia villosa TaxID=3911 RepID=UPI00273ACA71|nr:protein FAR1-RELATED SEQUENCE 11-like [Vicia villosa]
MNFNLNEYPIEEISVESGHLETIVDHVEHNIMEKDMLEVEKIGTLENEDLITSSRNVVINNFSEEVDEDGVCDETNMVPFIGQIFLSEEEAFSFYKRYAYHHGFSIRKGRFVKQKDGIISRRDFFCHREGRVSSKDISQSKEQRKRESAKCECKAHLRIKLQKSQDIFPSEWRVTTFVVEHNHGLLTQSEVRFLPSYRTISENDYDRIFLLKEGGLSVRQIMRVLELENNVKHGYLPFIEKDIRNLFLKANKKVEGSDAIDFLKYCENAKKSCSKFQYAYTLDEEKRLEHIFWSPASCFDWYKKYGDVVVFDTTYKVNSYEMPFGIFVGMNSHGKTILFGCALLRNETMSAFRWLMKAPRTILTDQDPWMKEAISKEMSTTKHSFCIWHITFKFSSWFNAILRDKYAQWCYDFYGLYKLETCEEFEHQWPKVVAKYNLQTNKYVKGLYEIRNYWALAYLREYFFGGMTTTGRSESINAFIKRFINSHTSLTDFAKQVDIAIDDIKQKEEYDIMLEKCKGSNMKLMSPLQEQAYNVLTRFSFQKFQDEFERSIQYSIHHENGNVLVLQYYKDDNTRKHQVFWDGKIAACSCKLFEFWGILCRHILSIFLHKDCYEIPPYYFPSRWRLQESHEDDEVVEDQIMDCNSEAESQQVVHCPPISKTKGRPKRRRIKGGKELSHSMNSCRLCKGEGTHFIN